MTNSMQYEMNAGPKLKLLLFGATRNTGYNFMQQALDAGHQVTAIIRNPEQFDFKHPNLKVVKGDVTQLSTFENEVAGNDAVISSLGVAPADAFKPTALCSTGVKNITDAMQQAGLKRIICVSASAVENNAQMNFFIALASRFLQWLLKYSYADLLLMEACLKRTDMNWTIVRPPRLTDKPLTGKYRVSVGSHLSSAFSIRRADLAHYMLGHVSDENTYRKIVEIGY